MTKETILKKLKDGNQRFLKRKTLPRTKTPSDLAKAQKPFCVVLTCADSRVSPELIFDQDLGDLFVIRIAGNTATEEAIGSIEFAAGVLGCSHCIVLGHSNCGAVSAAVDCVKDNKKAPSKNLEGVLAPIIGPAKESLSKHTHCPYSTAVEFNINKAVTEIQDKSDLLNSLKKEGNFSIGGAQYNLETGIVDFY